MRSIRATSVVSVVSAIKIQRTNHHHYHIGA